MRASLGILLLLSLMFGATGCSLFSLGTPGELGGQRLRGIEVERYDRKYLLYLPEGYTQAGPDWPLMLFLHGAGSRGDDLDLLLVNGPPMLISEGQSFPFIMAAPQCPEGGWWEPDFLDCLLRDVQRKFRVDEDRVYVTGLSMGGFGAWDLAIEYPDRFAAILPICGGGIPFRVPVLVDLPIWVFHGTADTVIPFDNSERMVQALLDAGSTSVEFTIYEGGFHDVWTETYANPAVYEWMLDQER